MIFFVLNYLHEKFNYPPPANFYNRYLSLILFTAIAIAACKKDKKSDNNPITPPINTNTVAVQKDSVPKTSANKYPGPCPYECGDPRCNNYSEPNPDCEESDLAANLASHSSFINLNVNFDAVLNMPTPDSFIQLFDSAQLSSQGDPYLSDITGFTIGTVSSITNSIQTNLQNMRSSFPELMTMPQSQLESVLTEATDIYLSNLVAKYPCSECKRIGRRNMIFRTLGGLRTGALFGFYGAWAGATYGFWSAASEAQSCLSMCD